MRNKLNVLFLTAMTILCVNYATACGIAKDTDTKNKSTKEAPVCNKWIHPDKTAYRILGRKLTDILINAKQVRVFPLTPKETITPDDYEVEPHFVRDSLLGTLTREQAVVLKYNLVSNGANYHNDSTYITMSPYYPIIEFECTKKKEVAHIIISPSTFTWAVKYDDRILFKYNYANGTFVKRFCNYFLQEKQQ